MTRPAVRAAILVAGLAFATMGSAQTPLPVRAVEHPEYSRLVLPIPAGGEWRLSRDGTRVTIRIVGAGAPYDLSGVFDRMPRTRILDASARPVANGQEVKLTLGCPCEVEDSRIGSGFLAVDVRRAPTAEADGPDGARFLRPATGMSAAPDGAMPPAAAPQGAVTADEGSEEEREVASTGDPVLRAREELMRQLSRAAEEGLLTIAPEVAARIGALPTAPAPEPPDPAQMPAAATPPPRITPPAPARPPRDTLAPMAPQLTVRDGSDPRRRRPAEPPAEITRCPQDSVLDPRQWAARDATFSMALGPLRAALIDPSGRVLPAEVGTLARHYLAAGFGREAEALLDRLGAETAEASLLIDLARVVEGRPLRSDGPVSRADGCTGRMELWRGASGLAPVATKDGADPDIRAALAELPPTLRQLVGHKVAARALRSADPAAARQILDILDRTPGGALATGGARVRTQLAIAEGDPARAIETSSAAVTDGQPDPALLEAHARAVLAARAPVQSELLDALDAAIRLQPPQEGLGLDLRLARIRLEAARGRPAEALAALRRLSAQLPAEAPHLRATGRGILSAIPPAERTGAQAVRAMLSHAAHLGTGPAAQDLRRDYASALLSGGLPQAALDLLSSAGELPGTGARLTAARAHVALGNPAQTLRLLDGLQADDAAEIRARAHLLRGDIRAGVDALSADALQTPYGQKLALLAGRPERIDAATAPEAIAFLAREDDPGGRDRATRNTLAAAQEGLIRASGVREAVDALLGGFAAGG